MQISDKTGIACDQCGTTYRTDFLYYSFDFRLLSVANNRRPSIDGIFRSQVTFSLDICTACFDEIKKKIIKHYESTMISDVRKRGKGIPKFICELTGKQLLGTYNYYHCNVVKVDVKMSGQPNVCVGCQTQTITDDQACTKCGGLDFVRLAITNSDDRHVEINISEETFQELVNKAETIRKVAGEWATKT